MTSYLIQYRECESGKLRELGIFSAKTAAHAIEIAARFAIRNRVNLVEIFATLQN